MTSRRTKKHRAALSSEHGSKEVSSFSIRSAGPGGQEFHLVPKPILKWSNPVRGSVHGDVYVWTLKGRPEVVCSFLEWFQPIQSKEVELHSLSLGPLVADRPDNLSWTTNQAGVELKPIPDAPAPAATPSQRLRQIRELAKDFTAHQVTPTGVDYEMRLLLQPIYHYEGTEGDLIDGALFAIVHATDPEVFLQIEGASRRRRAVAICPGPLQQQFNHRQPQGTRDLDRPADRSLRQGPRSPRTLHEHYCRAQPAVIVVFRKYSVDTACGVAIFVVIRRVP